MYRLTRKIEPMIFYWIMLEKHRMEEMKAHALVRKMSSQGRSQGWDSVLSRPKLIAVEKKRQ